jgi:hypothetical protein
VEAEQPPRPDRPRPSSHRHGREGFIAHAPEGGVSQARTHDDLTRAGELDQPSRHVHSVAEHDRLPRPRAAGHHLTGVAGDLDVDLGPPLASETLVQAGERSADLERGSDGAPGVVLVELRHAEHPHDRIADELANGRAVARQDLRDMIEVVGEDAVDRLGVPLLGHRGRAHDVHEQHRDDLPQPAYLL